MILEMDSDLLINYATQHRSSYLGILLTVSFMSFDNLNLFRRHCLHVEDMAAKSEH